MRVIVADDEFFARRAISKMLKEIMPDVEIVLEAETGREIMEAMEQTAADVIFFAYSSASIGYGVDDYLTNTVQKEYLRETLERILQIR